MTDISPTHLNHQRKITKYSDIGSLKHKQGKKGNNSVRKPIRYYKLKSVHVFLN